MPDVLILCTANVCRSPMAAALLRSWVEHHAPDLAPTLTVSSAGVLAHEGQEAAAHMRAIAERWGLELGSHRSRGLTADLALRADLVITMEVAHRDATSMLAHGLPGRTFTIRELAELLDHADPPAGGGISSWLTALNRGRPAARREQADVEDPYGGSAVQYEDTAVELADLVEQIAPALVAALRP